MARTNTYKQQVRSKIDYINQKARLVEKTFGLGSEQYQRYINATTAALPAGSYRLTQAGRLTISKSKENLNTLKTGQLNALTKLPTAGHSMQMAKQAQAKNALRASGIEKPSDDEIKAEAVTISDEEALAELAAKSFIQDRENSKGKLKYSESVKAEMEKAGAKTYGQLKDIIERGEKNDERKRKKAEYQREYRQRNREEVNRKQREYRQRNREEVNRKQREYRRRKQFGLD